MGSRAVTPHTPPSRSGPARIPARRETRASLSQSSPRPTVRTELPTFDSSTSTKSLARRALSGTLFRIAMRMSPSDFARYFAAFSFFAFAAASRCVFLRRAARFFTLSLPWLFPITRQHSPVLSQFQAVSRTLRFVPHSPGMTCVRHVYHPKAICFLTASCRQISRQSRVRGPIEWLSVRETRTRRLNSSPGSDDRRDLLLPRYWVPFCESVRCHWNPAPPAATHFPPLGITAVIAIPPYTAPASLRPFDAKLVAQIIGVALVLGVLVHLIFFVSDPCRGSSSAEPKYFEFRGPRLFGACGNRIQIALHLSYLHTMDTKPVRQRGSAGRFQAEPPQSMRARKISWRVLGPLPVRTLLPFVGIMGGPFRILAVDNEPSVAVSLKYVFAKPRYEV